MTDAHEWAEHPDLVEFFMHTRNRPEHLYRSERAFLPQLAAEHPAVLDVGCAGGGFFEIFRHYRPDIRYIGADFSHALTSQAGRHHPDGHFVVADSASGLPFADRSVPFVQALGWLHWENRHAEAIRELWRVTSRHLFFDMRVSPIGQPTLHARQRVAYSQPWDGKTTTPYIAVEWSELAEMLLGLNPLSIKIVGYWGHPAETVTGMECDVCFVTCVLEKRSLVPETAQCEITIDAPLAWCIADERCTSTVGALMKE